MTFMVKLPIVSHHRWRKIVEENVRECEADFRTVVRLSEGYTDKRLQASVAFC